MKEWRLGIFNGVMLACYFIPAWTISAFKIVMSPVRGMYEPANIGPAMFVSDHLSWSALGLVRFAWLFALSKFLVAAFFLTFLLLVIREALSPKRGAEEALAFALTLGSLISFGSMLAASYVGEAAAIRLHATELLMLLAAGIVLLVEGGVHERASADVPYAGRPPSSVISSSSGVDLTFAPHLAASSQANVKSKTPRQSYIC